MRTTKRFTPKVLERFLREGRGTGTYERYIPWHRVSRGDPSSRGRSHTPTWAGRPREFLSDGEFIGFCFATRLIVGRSDLREQFPLQLQSSAHELAAYDARFAGGVFPGTEEIAEQLGFRHPCVNGDGRSAPWIMTSDLLITRFSDQGRPHLLAVARKDDGKLSKRVKELLDIERTYWTLRDAAWLLLTPSLYHPLVGETLHRTWQWALSPQVAAGELASAIDAAHRCYGNSLTYLLDKLASEFANKDVAQRAVWQAIWSGEIPADLRRGWRPHLPLTFLPKQDFDDLNPILAGRSSWI